MIHTNEGYTRKSSFLFWDDDGQNKIPMTPSTLSPASFHEINSPLIHTGRRIGLNAFYNKVKDQMNMACLDEGNSEEEKIISEDIPCLSNNSMEILGWAQGSIQDGIQVNCRGEVFNYSFFSNNTDDMFQTENKMVNCRGAQEQIIDPELLLDSEKKQDDGNHMISSIQPQGCSSISNNKIKINHHTTNYPNNAMPTSIYNVTDTIFKEMRSDGSSEAKDISRYMDNEYLEVLKTNLMLEFTKSRTCYLKLVPSVIEIFKIVRDAPSRCPIPIVQSIDDLGKEKNIEEFENYFLNCTSKQNSGFLAFCTEKRALKSGGGGKYYFFNKKLQLNGCHKVDVLNHHKQKNILGPVFMKVLLFMFVVDPPYHLDPRARSSNPQRLMDFYYQLKSMNKLKYIKRLLKVWCMEMCPEEYLDAGYPLGSLLWVSTLDIESHIKKWRYRGKKPDGQFECMTPVFRVLEERGIRQNMNPGVLGLHTVEYGLNKNVSNPSDQGLDGLKIQNKALFLERNNCVEKLSIGNPDYFMNSNECNNSAVELISYNNSIYIKNAKKTRGRGRQKLRTDLKCFEDEESKISRKRIYLETQDDGVNMGTSEKLDKIPSSKSMLELELGLGMEFEASNFNCYLNSIWNLVRSIPIESLNSLYLSWLDGNIPGVTKPMASSPTVYEYLNTRNSEKSSNKESRGSQCRYKEVDPYAHNGDQSSEVRNSKGTLSYHRAFYTVIQQHLLMHASEVQPLLKALEENSPSPSRASENSDVVLNSTPPSQNLSISFQCASPLRMVEEQICNEKEITRNGKINSESNKNPIQNSNNNGNANIPTNNLVSKNGENIHGSQNISETPRPGNIVHDSSNVFPIISSQYQDFVDLPDITSTFSDQLLNDHTELTKNCNPINEPIDLFFAVS
ncbi:hypothetical protein HWI79_2410 [Cryptosporidium felis]|nr:hypothetical protein HWI79_2410 [Cryptosporidium felis]